MKAKEILLGLGLVILSTSAQAARIVLDQNISLQGRSIPDLCQFIYRIETDFIVDYRDETLPAGTKVALVYAFSDAYGENGNWLFEKRVDLQPADPGNWHLEITEETMSTNRHFLSHDLGFYFVVSRPGERESTDPAGASPERHYSSHFAGLMDRCYVGGRAATPYLPLEVTVR